MRIMELLLLATLAASCHKRLARVHVGNEVAIGYTIQEDTDHPNHYFVYYINDRALASARSRLGCGATNVCHEQHVGFINYVEVEETK